MRRDGFSCDWFACCFDPYHTPVGQTVGQKLIRQAIFRPPSHISIYWPLRISVATSYPMGTAGHFNNLTLSDATQVSCGLVVRSPLWETDTPKTAVTKPSGVFKLVKTLFGLGNAAHSFRKLKHEITWG